MNRNIEILLLNKNKHEKNQIVVNYLGISKKEVLKHIRKDIKSFVGYNNIKDKEESEEKIRNYLKGRFRDFNDKISVLQEIALSSQMIMIWGDLDSCLAHIRKTVLLLENKKYSGSSFFFTDSVRDVDLEILNQDLSALLIMEKLELKVAEFSDSIDSALLSSIPDITAQFLDSIDVFQTTWEKRTEIIKSFKYL